MVVDPVDLQVVELAELHPGGRLRGRAVQGQGLGDRELRARLNGGDRFGHGLDVCPNLVLAEGDGRGDVAGADADGLDRHDGVDDREVLLLVTGLPVLLELAVDRETTLDGAGDGDVELQADEGTNQQEQRLVGSSRRDDEPGQVGASDQDGSVREDDVDRDEGTDLRNPHDVDLGDVVVCPDAVVELLQVVRDVASRVQDAHASGNLDGRDELGTGEDGDHVLLRALELLLELGDVAILVLDAQLELGDLHLGLVDQLGVLGDFRGGDLLSLLVGVDGGRVLLHGVEGRSLEVADGCVRRVGLLVLEDRLAQRVGTCDGDTSCLGLRLKGAVERRAEESLGAGGVDGLVTHDGLVGRLGCLNLRGLRLCGDGRCGVGDGRETEHQCKHGDRGSDATDDVHCCSPFRKGVVRSGWTSYFSRCGE